jgi:diguanylate cyclase (GGDEF)-like protein
MEYYRRCAAGANTMLEFISPLPLIVGTLYLTVNLILLYIFLTPRRSPAFQAAVLLAAAAAAYLPYLNAGLRELAYPLMRYLLGCLYLVPCILIFKESFQAKIFVFFMNYTLTQLIFLLFTYFDRLLSPSMPQLCVIAGLTLELAALPLAAKRLKAPVREILGLIDRRSAAFTAFPILSFALLAYYGLQEFRPSTIIPLGLTTVLIFYAYYLISASISASRRQRELERISYSDSLTGSYNRRHMERRIDEELGRYRRTGQAFSLILIDIDFFKRVNDEHGHDCGDFLLKAIVGDISAAVRAADTLARWGGEEFLLLLPATDGERAAALAERVRSRIEAREHEYAGAAISVTATLGLSVSGPGDGRAEVVKRADVALYRGKEAGRNRVVRNDGPEEAEG